MILYLTATTNIPDATIDFIEARLQDGTSVSLNWDESDISRSDTGFDARYKGVYFGEEYANGRLADLEFLEITDIGLYYESEGTFHFQIDQMQFVDDEKELTFTSPSIPRDCSGMDGIVFMDNSIASAALVELQINTYDEHDCVSQERVFAVPKDWLMENFDFLNESALTDFLAEYTSDDSQEIYDAALLDHKIVFECDAAQLPEVNREYFRSHVIPNLMNDGITLKQVSEELTYRDNANATEPHAGWDDDLIDYTTEELELVEELWEDVASKQGKEKTVRFTFSPCDYEIANSALISSGQDILPWINDGYSCRLERADNDDIYYDLHLASNPGATVMYGESVEILSADNNLLQIHTPNDANSPVAISKDFFEKNFVPSTSNALEARMESILSGKSTFIPCQYISSWDGFGDVSSPAKYDPVNNMVYDVQTADLTDEELAECEILTGEYVELMGIRFSLGERSAHDTWQVEFTDPIGFLRGSHDVQSAERQTESGVGKMPSLDAQIQFANARLNSSGSSEKPQKRDLEH